MDAAPAPEPKVAPLIDVTNLPIADLLAKSHPNLARSIQQLIDSLDDPNGVISAFSSFVS